MSTFVFNSSDPISPSDADAALARHSAETLSTQLANASGAVQLRLESPNGHGELVTIPTVAARLLVTILAEMAAGNPVRLVLHHADLTTQEAADLLNVSRPYFVRLLDEGRLPFQRVGTHRRVRLNDVMAYKAEHRVARRAALKELARLDQELGLT